MPKLKKGQNKKNKFWQAILLLGLLIFALLLVSYFEVLKLAMQPPSFLSAFSTATFSVTISVLTTPSIFIIHPTNTTYNYSSIDLNFTVTNNNTIWHNLNNGDNVTMTGNITIAINNTRSYVLTVYSNNTDNTLNSSSVTFRRVNITFDRTEFNGETTDFLVFNDSQLQNITNLTLERTNRGKIIFLQNINISNNFTDLDEFIEIGINFISINSANIANFNKSADLYIYNLTFSNPRILRNGVVCPDTVCTEINYTGGVLRFNVTSFFINYSSEETPSAVAGVGVSGGGGGGGASGGRFVVNPFIVAEDSVKIKLQQGQTRRETLTITNNLDRDLSIDVRTNLVRFILILEDSFILKPKETKTVDLDIIAPETTAPDLYVGNIFINGDGIQKSIITAIEVTHKKPLFDVEIDIPLKYRQLNPGEELLATVTLFSIERVGLVDVGIEYIIKDANSKTIFSEEELLSVDVQASFIKSLKLPENIQPGDYLLYVRAKFGDTVGSSSAFFKVVELQVPKKIDILGKIKLYIYIILISALAIFTIRKSITRYKRSRAEKKRVIKPHEELHKLREHIKEGIKENGKKR